MNPVPVNSLPSERAESPVARVPAEAAGTAEAARFVLQRVQPALLGLMDGSVSTLARSSPPPG